MPRCVAVGCTTNSGTGKVMKAFPKDQILRKQWEAKVKRKDWKPTNSSLLCEDHFEESEFENVRADGKKKLKANALPTIFNHLPLPKKRKPPLQRNESPNKKARLTDDHTYSAKNNVTEERELTSPDMDDGQYSEVDQLSPYNQAGDKCTHTSQASMQPNWNQAVGKCTHTTCHVCLHLKEENDNLRCHIKKMEAETRRLKVCLAQSRSLKSKLQKQVRMPFRTCHSFLSEDQIDALTKKSLRVAKWSNETVKRALQLRFACGSAGYEELLNQNFPFPSIRTLQRRIEDINFTPGILCDVFEMLRLKVDSMKPQEKECILLLDEMAISARKEYDIGSDTVIGDVTLPGHSGYATKACVFMLAGITSRWKQIVAYHFTGESVDGRVFKDIINKLLHEGEKIGLRICAVTSDMGSSNQSMWRTYGIVTGRNCVSVNYCAHPEDSNRKLYFIADVPHLFKNIRSALINHEYISISEEIQKEYALPTKFIRASHIEVLDKHQPNMELKLAHKLTSSDLRPSHFEKMKVSKAKSLISHQVSSALQYLVQEENYNDELLTTAWFVNQVNKWFTLMTSRHPTVALSKFNVEKYKETIAFLENFLKIIESLKIGKKGKDNTKQYVFLNCHSIAEKMLKRFVLFRMKIWSSQQGSNKRKINKSSKSVAMRDTVSQI